MGKEFREEFSPKNIQAIIQITQQSALPRSVFVIVVTSISFYVKNIMF